MKFEAILTTVLLLAVSEAAPVPGGKGLFKETNNQVASVDTADMEAMEEATVDTEHAIKTMATSDDTTPSRIKSLELLGLMEMLELLEDRGDGDEEREAMAVDSEEG